MGSTWPEIDFPVSEAGNATSAVMSFVPREAPRSASKRNGLPAHRGRRPNFFQRIVLCANAFKRIR